MDELSYMLIESGVGCHIDNACVNHVTNTNDVRLIAPCMMAHQGLLNSCQCQCQCYCRLKFSRLDVNLFCILYVKSVHI